MSKKCVRRRRLMGMFLTAALALAGCSGSAPEKESHVTVENSNDTVEYNFVTAEIGDVEVTKTVNCTYRQQKDQPVCFAITGRLVDKVYVEEGDQVKRGMLLAELSAGNLEEQIEDLEYSIARNEILLEHIETNETLDISQSWVNFIYNHYLDEKGNQENIKRIQRNYRYQREDCQDALELDREKQEKLRQELASCRVYAQMDGSVYKLAKNLEGATSKAGEVVMTIVDSSQCLFEMENPEDAVYFSEGTVVTMRISSGSASGEYTLTPYDREHWGEIQQFSVLDGPAIDAIEVGTRGMLQYVTDSRSQVLTLPEEALHSADGKYYVYVTDEDNMRQIRWVEVGLIGDKTVEILSGLEKGERVVRK